MNPLSGNRATSPPASAIPPSASSVQPAKFPDIVQRFLDLNIYDTEFKTSLLNKLSNSWLLPESLKRLEEFFHSPLPFQLVNGRIHSQSPASLILKILEEFKIYEPRIQIAGSYVYKILGWEGAIALFKEAGVDLKSKLTQEQWEECKRNFEDAPSDVDMRIYLPIKKGDLLREALNKDFFNFITKIFGGAPLFDPYCNYDDSENHFLITGFVSPILNAEFLWIEGELAREELFRANGLLVNVPTDYLINPLQACPTWSSPLCSPLLRMADRMTKVVSIHKPLEVDKRGWAKLVVELSKGALLARPEDEIILFRTTFKKLRQTNKLFYIKDLLFHAVKQDCLIERWKIVQEAIRSFQRCQNSVEIPPLSKKECLDFYFVCFAEQWAHHVARYLNSPLSDQKLRLINLLYPIVTSDEGLDPRILAFIQFTVPQLQDLESHYKIPAFLAYLLRNPTFNFCAWRIYRNENITTPPRSKFLLGCVKASFIEGMRVLEDKENKIEAADKKEALDYVFSNLADQPANVIFSLSPVFLAKLISQMPETLIAKLDRLATFSFIIQDVIKHEITVPDSFAFYVCVRSSYGNHFIKQGMSHLKQHVKEHSDEAVVLLKQFKSHDFYFSLVNLFTPEQLVLQAEPVLEAYLSHDFDRGSSAHAKLLELIGSLLMLAPEEVVLKFLEDLSSEKEKIHFLNALAGRFKDNVRAQEIVKKILAQQPVSSYSYVHAPLISLFQNYVPKDIDLWIKHFLLLKSAPAIPKETSCRLWLKQREELKELSKRAEGDKNFLLLCKDLEAPLIFELPKPLEALADSLSGKNKTNLLRVIQRELLKRLETEQHREEYKTTLYVLACLGIETEEWHQSLCFLAKTNSTNNYLEALILALETKAKSCYFNLIVESLKFDHKEIIELATDLILSILDESQRILIANRSRNNPLFYKALLKGYFPFLAEDKSFFPNFKKALQTNFSEAFRCPTLSFYLKCPESNKTFDEAFEDFQKNAVHTVDPSLLSVVLDVYRSRLSKTFDGESFLVIVATLLDDLPISFEDCINLCREIYTKASASEKTRMREYLFTIKPYIDPLSAKSINLENFVGTLLVVFYPDDIGGAVGGYLTKAYHTIFDFARSRKYTSLFQSNHLFKLFFHALGTGFSSFATMDAIKKIPLVPPHGMGTYKRDASSIRTISETNGSFAKFFLVPEVNTFNPEAIPKKYQSKFYQQFFTLIDVILIELQKNDLFYFELLDFLAHQLHACVDNVGRLLSIPDNKEEHDNIRKRLIVRASVYMTMPLQYREIYDRHHIMTKILFMKLNSSSIYSGQPLDFFEHLIYNRLLPNQESLKTQPGMQTTFCHAFANVFITERQKFVNNLGLREIAFARMLEILEFYPLSYFGQAGNERGQVIVVVWDLLVKNPSLLRSPLFNFASLLNAYIPTKCIVHSTLRETESLKLLSLQRGLPALCPENSEEDIPPFLRCESTLEARVLLHKIQCGWFIDDVEGWRKSCQSQILIFSEIIQEKYPNHRIRYLFLTLQAICLEESRFTPFRDTIPSEYKKIEFLNLILRIQEMDFKDDDKINFLKVIFAAGNKVRFFEDVQYKFTIIELLKVLYDFTDVFEKIPVLAINKKFYDWLDE